VFAVQLVWSTFGMYPEPTTPFRSVISMLSRTIRARSSGP
jgi:hypothetical protein